MCLWQFHHLASPCDCLARFIDTTESEQVSAAVRSQVQLPKVYFDQKAHLQSLLFHACMRFRDHMKIVVPASPPLRSKFVRVTLAKGKSDLRIRSLDEVKDQVVFLLREIYSSRLVPLCNLLVFMDELEHVLEDPTKVRKSPTIWEASLPTWGSCARFVKVFMHVCPGQRIHMQLRLT